jgi:hypothetical protein
MAREVKIFHKTHEIKVDPQWAFTPIEKVYYDGKEVSSKMSILGARHYFTIIEEGDNIRYEAEVTPNLITGANVTVRRNGDIMFTNKV